jgi:RNA 2',3'-cyclic 3'-phosphodiesterase
MTTYHHKKKNNMINSNHTIKNNPVIRAFFAIDMPSHIKEYIFTLIRDTLSNHIKNNDVRWSSADYLHITLQFIPSMKTMDINTIIYQAKCALQNVNQFNLKLGSLMLFPDKNKPNVISLDVSTGKNELTQLSQALGKILNGMNYATDVRPYRPHLTLGKLTKKHQINRLQYNGMLQESHPINRLQSIEILQSDIPVKEITLFESRPTKNRTLYIPIIKITLKNS